MSLSRRNVLAGAASLAPMSVALPSIVRAATRRLRIGHTTPTDSVLQAAAAGFAKALQASSDGRFSVEIVPNSNLGTELQMLKAVADGTLDGTLATTGTIALYDKAISLVEMPYVFHNAVHARTAFDGALGRHCAEKAAANNVVVIGWAEVGVRHMTANKPIRTPADLKGLKLRMPYSDAMIETFKAMGAQAEWLAFGQLTEALRIGRFDAQDNPISQIVSSKLNEVQSTLSLTGHTFTAAALALSADVLEELPESDRALVRAAAQPGIAACRAMADRMDTEGLVILKKAGMTIVEDVDLASMRRAASATRDHLAAVFGATEVERIVSLAGGGLA